MKTALLSLAALGALAAAVMLALGSQRTAILSPRLGIPAVRLAGESFELELAAAHPWSRPAVTARLEGFLGDVALELGRERGDLGARRFTARIPEDAPPGSYELVVTAGEHEARRARAVWVAADFPDDVLIAQLADLPTFGHDGSGDRAFEQIVRELNLIDPDLVLLTGDIAYGGSVDQYARLYQYLLALEMPVVSALGNHEYEGLASYFETFGAPYHAVSFGGPSGSGPSGSGLWIVSLNSAHGRDQLTESQMAFLRGALDERGERTPILQIHHPLFDERRVMASVGEVRALVEEHGVPLVLSGHLHRDMVFDAEGAIRWETRELPGPLYVVTTAAGAELRPMRADRPSYHGYRLVWLSKGEVKRYSYDLDGDGAPDGVHSVPAGKLTIERGAPRVARVVNGWNETLRGARLRFELDGEHRGLRADGGEIVSLESDGRTTRVAVELDVEAGGAAQVVLEGAR